MVTSSREDGLSDATAWNVLRSAGIGGVVLSQSIAAYKLAVGDKAADSMRKNWRTKIFLRSEDIGTIDEAKRLAGKALRFQSGDWNHMESAVAVRRETGVSAESITPAVFDERMDEASLVASLGGLHEKFEPAEWENPFDLDLRFVPAGGPTVDGSQVLSARQAAFWRQEDRNAQALQHGASESETVQDQDLMEMGRGKALVFVQRGGGTRVDVIKLLNA